MYPGKPQAIISLGVGAVGLAALVSVLSPGVPLYVRGLSAALFVVAVILAFRAQDSSVRTSPAGFEIRGAIFTRRYSWNQVAGFRHEGPKMAWSLMGSPSSVTLVTTGGMQVNLPMYSSLGFSLEKDRSVDLVIESWMQDKRRWSPEARG